MNLITVRVQVMYQALVVGLMMTSVGFVCMVAFGIKKIRRNLFQVVHQLERRIIIKSSVKSKEEKLWTIDLLCHRCLWIRHVIVNVVLRYPYNRVYINTQHLRFFCFLLQLNGKKSRKNR